MVWGGIWRPKSRSAAGIAGWQVLIFALVLLSITVALWHGLRTQENTIITTAVSQELTWGKEAIIHQAEDYVKTAQRMTLRWGFYGDLHRNEWEYDAQYYIDQSPGVVAMGWIDISNTARYVLSRNGKDVVGDFIHSLQKSMPIVFETAKRHRSPQFSPMVHLTQGGERAVLVSPIFVNDRFLGFLIEVFDVNLAFGSVVKTSVDMGWIYHLQDSQGKIRTSENMILPKSEKWSQTTVVQIPGVSLTLKVLPGPKVLARLNSNLSTITLIVGLILTGLFTWGARAAQIVKIQSVTLRQIREALDSSSIVSMTDIRGNITYANDNFCKISQYSRAELLGQNHRVIKSGLHPKDYYVDMWRTIAHGNVWKGELCNRAKDGSLYWVYATIFPFIGENGKPESYMGIRHDITERKRLEGELRRSNRALEEFDHVVAHELKSPLTVIKLASENLTDTGVGPLNPTQGKMIEMIEKNADQLTAIINSLLHLAQHGTAMGGTDVRNLNAKRHANKVLQGLQVVAQKKNVKIRDEVPESLPNVKSSPGVFGEILTNLIGNAIRYAACEVVVDAQVLPGKVRFEVRDDGPGIPKEQHAKLFEKFTSDHKLQSPMFKGSGLGLYICKDLVAQMGGDIWVDSEVGKGTRFYFTLPIGDSESPPTAA